MRSTKPMPFVEADAALLDPELLERCAGDRFLAIETFLKVRDKEGRLVPLRIPDMYRRHFPKAKRVSLWLKGRQMFLTTSWDAWFYMDVLEEDGIKVLALNLDQDKAAENMQRVHDMDENRHPVFKELTHEDKRDDTVGYRETGSAVVAATIKNESTEKQADLVARSTTKQRVRWTESGFSRHYKTIKRATLDTVPKSGRIVIETTGNGAQGGFYEDCVETITHGEEIEKNIWVRGDTSFHFVAWFEHTEYRMNENPFDLDDLPHEARHLLVESEAEHAAEMRAFGYDDPLIWRCLYWRRWKMDNEKGLRTDPSGAIRNMDREYPATWRHGFQSTGSAYFNLTRIDQEREYWKAENKAAAVSLPMFFSLRHVRGQVPEEIPGNDFFMFEPPVRGYKHRYCGFLDPSGGSDSGAKTAGGMLDRLTLRMVAGFHGAYDPKEAAYMLMALGAYYDFALINWENDGLGLTCSSYIKEEAYSNIYRCEPDRVDIGGLGWHTDAATRKHMLGRLKYFHERLTNPFRVRYLPWYDEAGAFAAPPGQPEDRPRKPAGGYDDMVMMTAGLIVTHESMPAVVIPRREISIGPGQAHIDKLANLGKYRAAKERQSRGMRNF